MSTDQFSMRYEANVPKSFAREMRKKEKQERKDKTSELKKKGAGVPDQVVLRFIKTDKHGLCGNIDDLIFPLSDICPCGKPMEGEEWNCMLEKADVYGMRHCVPIEKIAVAEDSETESAEMGSDTETVVESVSETVEETVEVPETPVSETVPAVTAEAESELEKYRRLIAEITQENSELRAMSKEHEVLKRKFAELEEEKNNLSSELRTQKSNNSQLRNQISNLEKKGKMTDINTLQNKIQNLESENKNLKFNNERLTTIIEENNIDVKNVKGNSVFAMMTSSTTMHSSVFADGKYTVRFGKGFSTVRLIPDENGAVTCIDGNLELPALGKYAPFNHLAKLSTVVEDGIITVTA